MQTSACRFVNFAKGFERRSIQVRGLFQVGLNRDGIMSAAAEQHHIRGLQSIARWRPLSRSKIAIADASQPMRTRKATHLLGSHRIVGIANLQQQVAKIASYRT